MYVENIVIGKPIVEPSTIFALDKYDWNKVEKRKNILYRRKIFTKNLG